MTVLLAVEAVEAGKISLDDMVTASQTSWYNITNDSSNENIKPGETMSLKDLLYCALVSSAGEACNIIAEHVAGDVQTFVASMNQRATQLKCKGTNYTNTNGLPEANLYTTAWDQYLILNEAMKHTLFAQIASTATYQVPATNQSAGRTLKNTNKLLSSTDPSYFKYCTGGKTGSTSEAGYCLAAAAKKNDLSLISVVMGAKTAKDTSGNDQVLSFPETKRLFEWGFDSFSYRTILSVDDLVAQEPVEMGDGADSIVLRPSAPITLLLDNDVKLTDIKRDVTIYNRQAGKKLVAPINEGDVLGEVALSYQGKSLGKVSLVANFSIKLLHIEYLKSMVLKTLSNPWVIAAVILLVAGIVLYIVLVIRYNRSRKRKQRTLREKQHELIEERTRRTTTGKSFEEIYDNDDKK